MPMYNDVSYSESFSVPTISVRGDALNTEAYMKVFKTNLETALNSMGEAILARARVTVPRKNGYLSDSGRVEGQGLSREVIFGSGSVPYAAYQERGERYGGGYVVKHYTTPGTGKRYLRNAFDSVIKEGLGRFMP